MRGKVQLLCQQQGYPGITPAYAGKSFHIQTSSATIFGSPPPMRGKDSSEFDWNQLFGITPAYAGKSVKFNVLFRFFQDHPRLCGEKKWEVSPNQLKIGSPPPMRGKAVRIPITQFLNRITPAYAGKRVIFCCFYSICQDHPRLCGEKPVCKAVSTTRLGSPPPMRGKDTFISFTTFQFGITPAYAGKRKF